MLMTVRVVPNAKKTEIMGRSGTIVRIQIHAPAAEGRANLELINFLAEFFDVKTKDIKILRGHTGRVKIIQISGRPDSDLKKFLETIVL